MRKAKTPGVGGRFIRDSKTQEITPEELMPAHVSQDKKSEPKPAQKSARRLAPKTSKEK